MIIEEIIWDEFSCLEPPKPEWLEELSFWEEYVEKFFASNGLHYTPEISNIKEWLTSEERAPYANMADLLLDQLQDFDKTTLDYVFLAHWLPDVHLGTSVTNFAMHKLGVEKAFGIAFSDSGLEAPFIALDVISKSLNEGRQGILMIMDQKNLLYKTPIIDLLHPKNTACVLRIATTSMSGYKVMGFFRSKVMGDIQSTCEEVMVRFDISPSSTYLFSSSKEIIDKSPEFRVVVADPSHVCSAPFIALARFNGLLEYGLMISYVDGYLTGIAIKGLRHLQ